MITLILVSLVVTSTSLNVYGIYKYHTIKEEKKDIYEKYNRLKNMRRLQQKYGILY